MTGIAGFTALAAIWVALAWTTLFNSQFQPPEQPSAPTLRALHKGVVEIEWNDSAGADRHELQARRTSGWVSLPDDHSTATVTYSGSSAIVGGLPEDTPVDSIRLRAGNCHGWSPWSEPVEQPSSHRSDWDDVPVPVVEPPTDAQDRPRLLWSGIIIPSADHRSLGTVGYSAVRRLGTLQSEQISPDRGRFGLLTAMQANQVFVLELSGTTPLPQDFWLGIRTADEQDVARLSGCGAIRHETPFGVRVVWPNSDFQWSTGQRFKLSIEQGDAPDHAGPAQRPRLRSTLSAQFEEVPINHHGDEFSLKLRFSDPVTASADDLRAHALRLTGGYLTSLAPSDGRADVWEATIVPDGRSSVHIRLAGARGCADSGSICTQHFIPLSNQPEATVPGPPVVAEFRNLPDHHSGLDRIPVRIALSEPIFAGIRTIADLGLQARGGRVEQLRRVDTRLDQFEATLIPASSDDLVLSFRASSDCPADDIACLELRRIADTQTISIAPATIHLTFDDGPDPFNTPLILDILKRYNAGATFFVVGRSVNSFPELIERIVSEGHTLANHTWAHDDLLRLTEAEVARTLLRTQAALGEHATACFRPPYYRYNEQTVQRAAALGLRMVLNTGVTDDWKRPGAEVIAANIIASAGPNVILVLHDGGRERGQTIEALEIALRHLSEQRYIFEPVCE